MGLSKTPVPLPTMISPLGKACARMDLTAVQDILLKTGYKEEEGADNEVGYGHFTLSMSHNNWPCMVSLVCPFCGLICWHRVIAEAVIPRVDTTGSGYAEYKEIWRYCI